MTEHRYQARADNVSGEHEQTLDRTLIVLVTLTLTDAAAITTLDSSHHQYRPDVICPPRSGEARTPGGRRLLELADHAQAPTR